MVLGQVSGGAIDEHNRTMEQHRLNQMAARQWRTRIETALRDNNIEPDLFDYMPTGLLIAALILQVK